MKVAEKLQCGELTQSDIQFLENIKNWIRSSLMFSLHDANPCNNDVVCFEKDVPLRILVLTEFTKGTFISLGELVVHCEKLTSNCLVYEQFVCQALANVYRVTSFLNHDDGRRLVSFFKSSYCIEDEGELRRRASEAVKEEAKLLYG